MSKAKLFTQLYRRRAGDWLATLPDEGQGLVEYALILMFVAMAVVVILSLVGPAIGNVFSNLIPQL
jgi:pilus assembly protein Flp/PilA